MRHGTATRVCELSADAEITGQFEESVDDDGRPASSYATIDWPAVTAALDEGKPEIDRACAGNIFPALCTTGVTGPLSAIFSRSDSKVPDEAMWTYACSDTSDG